MRFILLVGILWAAGLTTTVLGQTLDVQFLRKQFFHSIENRELAEEMYDKVSKMKPTEPIHWGFVGGFEYLMAKHLPNPYRKMEFLKKAEKTLQKAIGMEPDNPEIRFLRFSSQHYLPSFLGMSPHLEEDRVAMVKHLVSFAQRPGNALAAEVIARFLVQSKRCTPAELKIVKACIPT